MLIHFFIIVLIPPVLQIIPTASATRPNEPGSSRKAELGECPFTIGMRAYGYYLYGERYYYNMLRSQGIIISSRWVLTYYEYLENTHKVELYPGIINWYGPIYHIYYAHEIFTRNASRLGLIKLHRNLLIDEDVKPIALSATATPLGSDILGCGWSWTAPWRDDPRDYDDGYMNFFESTVHTVRDCKTEYWYLSSKGRPEDYRMVDENFFCVGAGNETFDLFPGAPLFKYDANHQPILYGINIMIERHDDGIRDSYGILHWIAAWYPMTVADTAHNLEWIKEITGIEAGGDAE